MTRVLPSLLISALLATLLAASPGTASHHSRVAIIFEHAGDSVDAVTSIYAMREPFGLSILPHTRYAARIAREAAARGLVPILHLPMEALNPADTAPAAGAVWVRMSDAQITRVVEDDLASVPGVVGVSNHAGSRATADRRVMTAVLKALKARELWFLENRNSEASVAIDVAGSLGVRTVVVTTSLDEPPMNIEGKVRALIATAGRQGWAVGSAHLSTEAPQVVRRLLPEFSRAGIVFVPITEFLTAWPHR